MRILTGDAYCVFHSSVVKRDTPGPPKLSWVHHIKPSQEDSTKNYEKFPEIEYDGYCELLDDY